MQDCYYVKGSNVSNYSSIRFNKKNINCVIIVESILFRFTSGGKSFKNTKLLLVLYRNAFFIFKQSYSDILLRQSSVMDLIREKCENIQNDRNSTFWFDLFLQKFNKKSKPFFKPMYLFIPR